MWHANPQTSHTTPCRVSPTMSEVQWLHLSGEEKVRMRNWWDFGRGPTWMSPPAPTPSIPAAGGGGGGGCEGKEGGGIL